jgi:hypothetical protein
LGASALAASAAYGVAVPTPAETITANVASGPFAIAVQARRPANSPATSAVGTFVAHFSLLGANVFTLRGPVTCLDVEGDRAGLFYPITSSDPSLFAATKSGVFIYLQNDSSGRAEAIGFLPVPFQTVKSCAPGLALLPVTSGSVTLTR